MIKQENQEQYEIACKKENRIVWSYRILNIFLLLIQIGLWIYISTVENKSVFIWYIIASLAIEVSFLWKYFLSIVFPMADLNCCDSPLLATLVSLSILSTNVFVCIAALQGTAC